jgi:trehalose 6-phosphate phosphatase
VNREGEAGGALPRPRSEAGQAGLAALLQAPGRALIALDYDGTLAPIVSDPMAARPHPGAAAALRALAPLAGTLAVISGRPAREAVTLGGLDQIPGLIVLGLYGRQRWEAGTLTAPPAPPGVAAARRELPAVLAAAGAPEGTWTEDKGDALAVHPAGPPSQSGPWTGCVPPSPPSRPAPASPFSPAGW